MRRRFLCLFFPRLVIDRLEREDPRRGSFPLAVAGQNRAHLYLAAVNDAARRAGLRRGMRLADARAILPALQVVPADPEADRRLQARLVRWCGRYSPLAAEDGADGIALDITGCAHLFGGEAALLQTVLAGLGALRFRARGAIAGTAAGAWALARFGQGAVVADEELAGALDPLPVRALRLCEETAAGLERVGLATIGDLRRVPRDALAARYGPSLPLRLDQALGLAAEPLTPHRPPPPYRAARMFAEPIGATEAVARALAGLLAEVCQRLEKEHRGARRFALDCCRVDGTAARLEVRTSAASRSAAHLARLFAEKLDSLDAGFGIEAMALEAFEIEAAAPAQMALAGCGAPEPPEAPLDELLDRLGQRLGFEQVCRFRIRESFLAESSVELAPVGCTRPSGAAWPRRRLRPVYLIEPPTPIQIAEMIPGKWPVRIRAAGELHRIVRAEGPERLTPEWWGERPPAWKTRDYYRIENERGARFWIFRETGRGGTGERWFLHGQFP
jgi:protein ImuB